MTSGPDFVSFQSRDFQASGTFYEKVVGLHRLPPSNSDAVVFSDGGPAFAVRKPFPSTDLDAHPQLGAGIGVWFAADDVQAVLARVRESGRPITQEPFDGPFGTQFAFTDPDGYTVTIHGQA